MHKILIIDICDTLYPCNTTFSFIESITKNKSIRLLKNKPIKIINKILCLISGLDIIRYYYLSRISSLTKEYLEEQAKSFVSTLCPNKAILELVELYRAQGFELVIISASIDPVISVIGDNLSCFEIYSSELEYDSQGLSTGMLHKDLLGHKHSILKTLRARANEIVMVTDNKSDVKCKDYCDKFIAVIPAGKSKNILFWDARGVKDIVCL